MPFDSNGTFNRVIPGGWKADAAANIKIRADRHDDEDDGFATGLSTCITKDGRTQPTANIPMNNKKIIALGEPSNPTDAATKNYVDTFKSFTTGANITGAGPINGFINFTSPSGVNGIGWATADMSWIGRLEEANKSRKRLAVNDKKDGTGLDVAIVDEAGNFNLVGAVTTNLSHDGTSWRTIGAGTGSMLTFINGAFTLSANDETATTVDYQNTTPRLFGQIAGVGGSANLELYKSASGKEAKIVGYMGTAPRWRMDLGNATVESATRTGSDFVITGYDNTGAAPKTHLTINRADGNVTVGEGGGLYAGSGLRGRAAYNGAYGANWINFNYAGGYVYTYVDGTLMGAITWQSDYRIKRDITALPSMWDKVKSLNPVRYKQRKFGFFESDDTERWGMIAHELQEKLTPSVAIGNKDEENVIQSVNPLTLIAVLTKALQEAMERIEALEAKA
jgi:hypothetical protein